MGVRSKVELLPDEVRKEFERRLIAGGFSGYEELAAWLEEQGFKIGKSSLHRWGTGFEDKCAGLKIATEQARAIVEASPDREGAMGQALTRLVQEKLFGVLLAMQIDPDEIELPKLTRAIADMSRAAVTQQKHASEVRKQAREEMLAEQKTRLDSVARKRGMSAETADEIRREILGIT